MASDAEKCIKRVNEREKYDGLHINSSNIMHSYCSCCFAGEDNIINSKWKDANVA